MCIRDSDNVVAATVQVAFLGSLASWAGPDAATPEIVEARTVSYTHLRAHETVLDLVCRLLLEQKKTNHSNALQHLTIATKERDMTNST